MYRPLSASIVVLGIFWRGPLVVEPALRPRRQRLDFHQLGDDRDDPHLYLSAEGNLRIDVVFSQQWPSRPAVLGARTDAQARTLFCDLCARLYGHFALEILLLNLRAWQLREPLRLNERED